MKKILKFAVVAITATIMLSACNSGPSASISNPGNVIDLTSQGKIVSTPTDTQAQYAPEKPFLPMYSREPDSWWDGKIDSYNEELSFIDGTLCDLIGTEKFNDWLREFNALKDLPEDGDYRNRDELNIVTFVREFQISRADFETALSHKDFYTEEVIDALYSDDIKAINKAFVNPYALYYDGKIYTMQWLEEHTAADYESEGISTAELTAYLERVKGFFVSAKYENAEGNYVFKSVEDKAAQYALSVN